MSRKVDGTQRSGRGTAPPAAGGFGGADTALTRLARPFTPKPFRSTGGMSTSADTMMSIGMGRHHTDEEIPEDQVNISSIVSSKTSDRRYLPRKLGNMKYYLHTTSISESLALSEEEISERSNNYEKNLNEFLEKIGTAIDSIGSYFTGPGAGTKVASSLSSIADVAAPFVPFLGDAWFAIKAVNSARGVVSDIKRIQSGLASHGVMINFSAPVEENHAALEMIKSLPEGVREQIRLETLTAALDCYNFILNLVSSIPLEVFPAAAVVDSILDAGLTVLDFSNQQSDPTGEKTASLMFDFFKKYRHELESIEDKIGDVIPGKDFAELNVVTNGLGNLAQVNLVLSTGVLPESRRRKKKRADETSTTASITGYVSNLQAPRNPEQFYDKMAKAYGGNFLVDPVKSVKPKP